MKRLFRMPGGRPRDEIDDEIRFHLERKVQRLVEEGMSREQAEAEARRRFGDPSALRDEVARVRRGHGVRRRRREWLGSWRRDVSYALRRLVRSPVFSAVTLLTIAVGIGFNTAVFSVVDGILFRPLPYPEADELVRVWSDVTERGGPEDEWLSYANFHDLKRSSATLDELSAWGGWTPTWTDGPEPEQLVGARVTAGMFGAVLRVTPEEGRGFTADEDVPGAPGTILIGHDFALRAFGGAEGALGERMTLDDESYEIVGVMPRGFRPPFVPGADVWSLSRVDLEVQRGRRGGFSWRTVGRLAEGRSVESARAEFLELGARLESEYPESNTGMTFAVVPLRDDLVEDARAGLLVLLGAVGLVLLVACVNVANLLLARAADRHAELALRSALGAGRRRLMRQLFTESLVLAVLGGVAGVALAFIAADVLVGLAPAGTPRLDGVVVDGRVLLVTAAVTLAAGVLFGLVPALRGARSDLHDALALDARGAVGGGAGRARAALVAGQVALALMLLIGAGLLTRSLQKLRTADLGFTPDGLVTAQINLPTSRYGDAESRIDFYRRLEDGLRSIPGVESVGSTSTVPLSGLNGDVDFEIEGREPARPGEETAAWFRRVTPGYLPTMEIALVAGRNIEPGDVRGGRPVVVINETLADRFFPRENPIGQRLNFNNPATPVWREIVGIARDIRNFGIRESSRFAVYVPYDQLPGPTLNPVLATGLPPVAVASGMRSVVAEIDPSLAVAEFRTMNEVVTAEVAPERFLTFLLSTFAALALLLAVVGLYGVVAYTVGARTRELGVRLALGAPGANITWIVLRRSLSATAAGIGIGLVGSALLSRLLGSLLYGVSPVDPVTFGTVSALLVAAAAVASGGPAIRAVRIDPTRAIRAE